MTHADGLTTEQPVAPGKPEPASTQGTMASLDDSQPVVTTKMGVSLAEQQQVVVKKAADGNIRPMTKRADAHLNETDWDLQKMLNRENLVGAFQWSLTDVVGSELSISGTGSAPTDVPQDLLKNDIVTAPFLRFQWMRFDKCNVRFQITASRFHQGRLLAYYVPTMLPKSNVGPAGIYGPTRATQVQHCFLDPANGFVGDMEIPFRYTKGFIDLVFGDVLGQLRVQVLNGLQAASGSSTSVEVKVFVSFEGTHFRVPRPGGASFETLSALAKRSGAAVLTKNEIEEHKNLLAERDKLRKQLAKSVDQAQKLKETIAVIRKRPESDDDVIVVEYQSGTFASMGSGIGGEIDKIIEDVLPKEVTGLIAGISLDKPAVTEYPEILAHKDAQYMSPTRGVEKLERMTAEPSAMYITTDQFGDNVDEMDMKFLLKKPTFLTRFNWSSTQTVGTVLYDAVVSPTHFQDITNFGSVPKEPTPLTALANLFTFWRGGFVLMFQIIGTAFHEGRLDFCNHPGTTNVPSDYATSVSQYVNSQTIRNTNNTVEVRIPFHSDTPWKRVWFGENLSDTVATDRVRSMDYVTGSFSVRVAVPLKNPNNVANNVDVNVFICAADDFQFHTTSIVGGLLSPFIPAFFREKLEKKNNKKQIPSVEYQAGDLNTDTKDDKGVINLGVGSVYTYDPPVKHFGETYSSLRELCKRYWLLQSQDFQAETSNLNLGKFATTSSLLGGLAGYLSQAYRVFRGPMNGKIQMGTSQSGYATGNVTGFVTLNPQPALFSSGSLTKLSRVLSAANNVGNEPRIPPLVRFSTNQVAEFQVPFQSIYHSLLMDQPTYDTSGSYYGNQAYELELDWCIQTNMPGVTVQLTLALAFGDETRFGVFLGFPSMVGPSGGPSYPNPSS